MALDPGAKDTDADDDFVVDPAPGLDFGRYKIESTLGSGAMGSVYLAHDNQLQRKVALKVPKFKDELTDKQRVRFYREARAAANLTHPNICAVYDVGEIDGTLYIAMAYIKGRPLSDYIVPDKPTNAKVAATIIRKIALAMQEAHAAGIVHRDIKPANIMVDQRKEPVVMDFGLAQEQVSEEETRLTQQGAILGSPAYMSKEQLEGDINTVGPAADVYSLGVVLFELLTGELPFKGSGSVVSMLGEILTKEAPNPSVIRRDIDPQLAKVCCKAMAKEVEDRYESMAMFASALATVLRTYSSSDGSLSVEAVQRAKLDEHARMAKTLVAEGQHQAAASILTKIATKVDDSPKQAAWATAELKKVKTLIAKQKQLETAAIEEPSNSADDWLSEDILGEIPTSPASSFRAPTTFQGTAASSSGKSRSSKRVLAIAAAIGCLSVLAVGIVVMVNAGRPGETGDFVGDGASSTVASATPVGEVSETIADEPIPNEPLPIPPPIPDQAKANNDGTKAERLERGDREPMRRLKTEVNRRLDPEVERIFTDIDRNRDDQIDESELPPGEQRMMDADANGDGSISRDELAEFHHSGPPLRDRGPPHRDSRREMANIFDRFDENSDGELTERELPPPLRPRFNEADSDRDGALNLDEFQSIEESMGKRRPGERPREGMGKGPRPPRDRP